METLIIENKNNADYKQLIEEYFESCSLCKITFIDDFVFLLVFHMCKPLTCTIIDFDITGVESPFLKVFFETNND